MLLDSCWKLIIKSGLFFVTMVRLYADSGGGRGSVSIQLQEHAKTHALLRVRRALSTSRDSLWTFSYRSPRVKEFGGTPILRLNLLKSVIIKSST